MSNWETWSDFANRIFNHIRQREEEKKMKFEEILPALRDCKAIKCARFTINPRGIKVVVDEEFENSTYSLEALIGHIVCSEDWEIIEKTGKTFPEVFEEFKKGKAIRRKSWVLRPCIHNKIPKELGYNSLLDVNDLLATDWEVLE